MFHVCVDDVLISVYSFLALGTYFIHDVLRATLHTHTFFTKKKTKNKFNSISCFTGINHEPNKYETKQQRFQSNCGGGDSREREMKKRRKSLE